MRKKYLFVFILFVIPAFVLSGTQKYKRSIIWKGIQKIEISENEYISILRFEGSLNDYTNDFLPVYFERIPLSSSDFEFSVQLFNKIFEPVSDKEIQQIEGLERINEEISITGNLSFERKKPYASISFVPIRKNEITGFYERLIAFEIEITTINTGKPQYQLKSSTYKESSVLATGNWYKIAVTNTGIHKISYQELQDMGIDVNSINPKNIRLYGNGGGMLPENPTIFRYDDLQENAIIVVGEEDGSFDNSDYILFYGQSPDVWKFDGQLYKTLNLYSDYTYYFITTDLGEGKRIQNQASSTSDPTNFVSKFDEGYHHEIDEVNLIKSGRVWYGETFDLNNSLIEEFNITNLDLNSKVYFEVSVAARSDKSSSFDFYFNNEKKLNIYLKEISNESFSVYAKAKMDSINFYPQGTNIKIEIIYNKSLSSSVGWLNYFTLNVVRNLAFTGGQLAFRSLSTAGQEYVTEYTVSNAPSNLTVWNVTKPLNIKNIETTNGNDKFVFRLASDTLQEFVAYDGSSFYSVGFTGKINNQNLHGTGQYDMIIITHPLFTEEANRLANHHKTYDDLSVFVVETPVIYNEFSSGAQDITAIRDFVKMLYDKASLNNEPRYLLLFGDGSYDNKNRIVNNTNYIPTWESVQSLHPISSIVKDDFYGLLDNIPDDSMLDIGIGRFIVSSVEQAKNAVDKVIHYSVNTNAVMGDWRNVVCLIADDEDSNLHFKHAEQLAALIQTMDTTLNIDKIYLDAFQQISTPTGERYPAVTQAINNRVKRGALIMNYVGHGGEGGLAHERITQVADINSWSNFDNMPVFITATCEVSRFDDPGRTSAGEYIFLNPEGGGISLFTTTRPTFASSNLTLNKNFIEFALKKIDGEYYRLGDVIRLAKNQSVSTENTKFMLMGDPALKLAFPEHNVITAAINNISVTESIDTIRALSEVTISGEMQDYYGNKLTDFNGVLYPTVFDKPAKYSTLGNDPGSTPATFYIQKNALYKGKASVTNGEWSFTFIAPKDIAYQYGFGKLSYYAKNENIDGAGYFVDVVIGGYNENAKPDICGPTVELFMNDINFIKGGLTDENPVLLAYVFDESGINTVGSGIGHDILATLDESDTYILNDYYESDLDNYKNGTIIYPFFNLNDGYHKLTLKVWDVYNNSSTVYTEFIVAESNEMAIKCLMNYPNPFKYSTTFSFEHNQAEQHLDVIIRIYSMTGQLVKTISDIYYSGGYKYKSFEWNGTDDGGNKLRQGIYIYRVIAKNPDGTLNEKRDKLVILK